MCRLLLLVLAVCGSTLPIHQESLTAQPRRGTYYRSSYLEFEMWVPEGFSPAERSASSLSVAGFESKSGPVRHVGVFNRPLRDRYEFDRYIDHNVKTLYRGAAVEPLDDFEANGRMASVFLIRVKNVISPPNPEDVIFAGLDNGSQWICLSLLIRKGELDSALAELRWMMATFRRYGRAGLDPLMHAPRTHEGTGLVYRVPKGFYEVVDAEDPDVIFRAVEPTSRATLTLTIQAAAALKSALETAGGAGAPDRKPLAVHNGLRWDSLGAFYPLGNGDGRRGRALVAVTMDDHRVLMIRVEGSSDRRERLVRAAELVCMSLDAVDLERIRRRVEAAVRALEQASEDRDRSAMFEQLEILADHFFMRAARQAVARACFELSNKAAQKKAITLLGRAGHQDLKPFLLEALERRDVKEQLGIVAALLAALGRIADPATLSVFAKHARHEHPHVAAAAIRAFGRFSGHRTEALEKLIRVMRKEERAARRSRTGAQARWAELEPAFHEALNALTGETIRSSGDARRWLRTHR